VTTPYDHAPRLTGLAGLGITLPAQVRNGIAAYQAAMGLNAMAPQGRAVVGATARAAADIARRALTAKGALGPLDVTPVTRARQAEQEAADRAALARELRGATSRVLAELINGPDGERVIGALQARHREVLTGLCEHAQRLPAGVDDAVALAQGGQVREDYLAVRDAAAEAAQLREALADVEDARDVVREFLDGVLVCAMFEKSGGLYQQWMAPTGQTTFGPPGTFVFYLAACREPGYEWWLPTVAEAEQRAAEQRKDMHARRTARLPESARL
jgi:hypothetical protein